MQTLVRNIQLNFADGEKKLTVGNLSLQKNYINILEKAHFLSTRHNNRFYTMKKISFVLYISAF